VYGGNDLILVWRMGMVRKRKLFRTGKQCTITRQSTVQPLSSFFVMFVQRERKLALSNYCKTLLH
jgi:hypothetical protein